MPRINAVTFHENPSIESICRIVKGAGFDSIEVSRPPFFNKLTTVQLRRDFAAWARRAGLSLHGFDAWVDIDPYSTRQKTLGGLAGAFDFAADLALGAVISHDPWGSVNSGRSPSQCLADCTSMFREAADQAAASDLELLFEPHPDTLSMDNSWAIDFIDGIGRANVGLVYDCCHYGVGQPRGYVDAIPALGSRIRHVHFSDGDAQTYALHLPLGDGVLDLQAIVAGLKAIRFSGTLTNDLYNYPMPEDGARRNADRIHEVEDALGIEGGRR